MRCRALYRRDTRRGGGGPTDGLFRRGSGGVQPQHGTRAAGGRGDLRGLVPAASSGWRCPPAPPPWSRSSTTGRASRPRRRCAATSPALPRCTGRSGADESAGAHPVRFALQRMHRRLGAPAGASPGLTWPLRTRLLEAAGDRLIDARTARGADTLLRRSAGILEGRIGSDARPRAAAARGRAGHRRWNWLDDLLEEIDGTATLLVRSGKTDAEGRGATLYLARDTVQLVKTWLDRGGVDGGSTRRSGRLAVPISVVFVTLVLPQTGRPRRRRRVVHAAVAAPPAGGRQMPSLPFITWRPCYRRAGRMGIREHRGWL